MKKLLTFCLLVALMMIPASVWADAEFTSTLTGKACTADYCSGGTVGVSDIGNGYSQRVDDTGAAYVKEKAKAIANTLSGAMGVGVSLVAAPARVSNIIVSGAATTALDFVLIYDALTATGTAKFDISLGTAGETVNIVIPGGASFATGVYAIAGTGSTAAPVVTVLYDN